MISLELPLAVEDRDTALEMLGGVEALSRAVESEAPLLLDLCPERAMTPPLIGDVGTTGPTRALVALRVSKRRKKVVGGEVVGRVAARCHFWNSLADFEVNRSAVRVSRQRANDLDQAYKYAEWPDAKRGGTSALRIRHGDAVPSDPTPTARLAQSSLDDPRLQAQLDEMKDLFSRRAIWRRKNLQELLGSTPNELSALLPMVAFEMLTGPWRRTWIRFGHDARADPRSRFLQVVDHAHGKQRAVQLCDIDTRAAQDAVLNAPRADVCHAQTGWFTKSFLDDDLRKLLLLPPSEEEEADDPPLSWSDFLANAAVADCNAELLADEPPSKRPRSDDDDEAPIIDDESEEEDD